MGQLPTANIKLAELESQSRLPSATELQAVRRLHALAIALDHRFSTNGYGLPHNAHLSSWCTPEPPEKIDSWRQDMHRAIYRSLIASASLAALYLEPIFKAAASSDPGIQQLSQTDDISEAQLSFVRQFTVYKTQATPEQDHETFSNTGDWLLRNILSNAVLRADMERKFSLRVGRALGCYERNTAHSSYLGQEGQWDVKACPVQLIKGHSHADAHTVSLELIRMLWVSDQIVQWLPFNHDAESQGSILAASCGPVVPWNLFSSQVIGFTTPRSRLPKEPNIYVTIFTGHKQQPRGAPWLLYEADHDYHQGGDFEEDDNFMPPLTLKFFAYFLQRHLHAAFEPKLFQPPEPQDIWDDWKAFREDLRIFSRDEVKGRVPYYRNGEGAGSFSSADFLDGADILVPWVPLETCTSSPEGGT